MRKPFVFFLLVAALVCVAADLPSHLTCNITRTPDGLFKYTVFPTPTVTDLSSSSWANGTGHVFTRGLRFSAELVQNITENSVTLWGCEDDMRYRNEGKTLQEAICHVNCSLHTTPPPTATANHIICLNDHWCPPISVVLFLALALALLLLLVSVLVWWKRKGPRCRWRSSEEEPNRSKFEKDSDLGGKPEEVVSFL